MRVGDLRSLAFEENTSDKAEDGQGCDGLGMMSDMRQPFSSGGRPVHGADNVFGGDRGGFTMSGFKGAGGVRTSGGRPSRREKTGLGGMRGSVPKDLACLAEGKSSA